MKKIITLLLLFLSIQFAWAQKQSADHHYSLYEYAAAIKDYEDYLSKTPNDYEALKHLCDAYLKVNDIEKAIGRLTDLVKMPQSDNDDLLQLVQVLRMNQQFSDAKTYAVKYKEKKPGLFADNLIYAIDNHEAFITKDAKFSVNNLSKPLGYSVISVLPWNGKLLVTAEGNEGKKSKWTGRNYTRLYLTNNDFLTFTPFASEVMNNYDNGTPSFNSVANQMFFACVNEKSLEEGNVLTKKLKVVSAMLEGNKWGSLQEFQYTNAAYNTAHPTLSKDGKYLVFASDMPGGKGGMDLYYCERNGNGWSQPVNLSALNTEVNELFPSFQKDNALWFSSEGLPGLGGLDIFQVDFKGGNPVNPTNMKTPVNSSFDDFGLYSDDGLKSGYFVSNRDADKRIDNVFKFSLEAPQATAQKSLQVLVLDKYTNIPLPYAKVEILKDGAPFQKGMTDENGAVMLEDFPLGNYSIKGELNDITTTTSSVSPSDFSGASPTIIKTLYHNDPRFTLKGIVVNSSTNQPVEGVTVTCFNSTLNITKTEVTKADGVFNFQLEQKSDFRVTGMKAKWLSSERIEETTKGLDRSKEIFVKLTLKMDEPKLNQSIRLDKIYYDYNKWNIRPEAAIELDRVVQLMVDYPDMSIELSSHTDSRGSDTYNETLSQNRADAAVNYIINKGIASSRIVAKGYGESMLLNRCGNGVTCSEAEHQLNRRTEFKIISCSSCPK